MVEQLSHVEFHFPGFSKGCCWETLKYSKASTKHPFVIPGWRIVMLNWVYESIKNPLPPLWMFSLRFYHCGAWCLYDFEFPSKISYATWKTSYSSKTRTTTRWSHSKSCCCYFISKHFLVNTSCCVIFSNQANTSFQQHLSNSSFHRETTACRAWNEAWDNAKKCFKPGGTAHNPTTAFVELFVFFLSEDPKRKIVRKRPRRHVTSTFSMRALANFKRVMDPNCQGMWDVIVERSYNNHMNKTICKHSKDQCFSLGEIQIPFNKTHVFDSNMLQ